MLDGVMLHISSGSQNLVKTEGLLCKPLIFNAFPKNTKM